MNIDNTIQIANTYNFESTDTFYNYCIDSYYNGNFSQCKVLFNELNKEGKKSLLTYIKDSDIYKYNEVYNFYFKLF